LLKSNIDFKFPNIGECYVFNNRNNHNGPGIINENDCKDNWEFTSMQFFCLLDAIIDFKHPALKNKNFKERYERLSNNKNTDFCIIFMEIYRLMTIFRNKVVHNKDAITFDDNSFEINDKLIQLKISIEGVRLLNTIVILLCQMIDMQDGYSLHILNNYYTKILAQISKFSDNHGKPLLKPKVSPIVFNLPFINRIQDAQIENKDDERIISIKILDDSLILPSESYEYKVFHKSKHYYIPHEFLIKLKREITEDDISAWEVSPENPMFGNYWEHLR